MKNAIFYGNAVAINADLIASTSTSSLHLLPVQHCTRAAFEAMVASPSAPSHPIQIPGQWPPGVRPGRRLSAPRLQSSVHFESYDTSFCLIKRCTQQFLTRHPNVGAGRTKHSTSSTCGASLRFQCQDDVARLMVLSARPVLLHHDFHIVLLSSTHILSPTADFGHEIV